MLMRNVFTNEIHSMAGTLGSSHIRWLPCDNREPAAEAVHVCHRRQMAPEG